MAKVGNILMKNIIKKFLDRMKGLWQSKNKDCENFKLVAIAFFVIALICFVLSSILHNDNAILTYIAKYTFKYMGYLFSMFSINFLTFHFYIFNKIKSSDKKRLISMILSLILLGLTLILAIPFTISVGILGKILIFRAKKIDNLITFMIFLAVVLTFIVILIYPNFIISYLFSNLIKNIIKLKLNFYLEIYPISLFIFLTLCTFEINLIFKLLIFIQRLILNKDSKHKRQILEKSFQKNINISNLDIKAYVKDKNDEMKNIDSKLTSEVEYDISYLKNTLKRIELTILIILFIIIALKIVPLNLLDLVKQYQSDSINVITIYTLIMLYMDKRKEWK